MEGFFRTGGFYHEFSCTNITPTWRRAVAAVSKIPDKIPLSWRSLLFSIILLRMPVYSIICITYSSSANGTSSMLCAQAGGRRALSWPRMGPSLVFWLVDLNRTTSLQDTVILFNFKPGSVPNTRPSPLPELGFFYLSSSWGEDVAKHILIQAL